MAGQGSPETATAETQVEAVTAPEQEELKVEPTAEGTEMLGDVYIAKGGEVVVKEQTALMQAEATLKNA